MEAGGKKGGRGAGKPGGGGGLGIQGSNVGSFFLCQQLRSFPHLSVAFFLKCRIRSKHTVTSELMHFNPFSFVVLEKSPIFLLFLCSKKRPVTLK